MVRTLADPLRVVIAGTIFALAQRVEVADGEVRIMGSNCRLLQVLTGKNGVNSVPTQGLKWRRGRELEPAGYSFPHTHFPGVRLRAARPPLHIARRHARISPRETRSRRAADPGLRTRIGRSCAVHRRLGGRWRALFPVSRRPRPLIAPWTERDRLCVTSSDRLNLAAGMRRATVLLVRALGVLSCWPAHLPPPWSMGRVRSRINSLRLRLWVWRWRRSSHQI